MIAVRFHGRGGQGARIASRILGRSGFLSGLEVQDFALFGPERRGAPVVACTRLADTPIDRRGHVDEPDILVVMDFSLLADPGTHVLGGIGARTPVFVNLAPSGAGKIARLPEARYVLLDLDGIARRLTGRPLVSAAAAAVAAKCIPTIALAALLAAIRIELAEFASSPEALRQNEAVAAEAYEAAPAIRLAAREPRRAQPSQPYEPPLAARLCGPTVRRPETAALRRTGSWRTERPGIDLARCKRCFLCYLYCPEAAIRLDASDFPHIDYEHCKGCMTCYRECPTDAVGRGPEATS
ncbi:MAG TPA: 2-oxoacid:acceptor oxidoreductase family protein [candidate division Zixibacteria bacterium]|nr:2-oxoacid:acceptor oxidoreductase family protein [candidate division Zixibacteria bacterium]